MRRTINRVIVAVSAITMIFSFVQDYRTLLHASAALFGWYVGEVLRDRGVVT